MCHSKSAVGGAVNEESANNKYVLNSGRFLVSYTATRTRNDTTQRGGVKKLPIEFVKSTGNGPCAFIVINTMKK